MKSVSANGFYMTLKLFRRNNTEDLALLKQQWSQIVVYINCNTYQNHSCLNYRYWQSYFKKSKNAKSFCLTRGKKLEYAYFHISKLILK